MEGFLMAVKDKMKGRAFLEKSGLIKLIVAVAVGIVVVGTAAYYAVNYFNTKEMRETLDIEEIYPNVLVNSINIGGLKKEDAIKKLEQDLQEPFSKNVITFIVDDKNVDFTYEQFGIKYNIEAAVEQAYNYARDGSIEERYDKYERLKMNDAYSFDASFLNSEGQLSDEVKAKIRSELEKNLKDKVYRAPKNATVKRENGSFSVVSEEKGRELDLDRAVNIVVEAIEVNQGDGTLIHVPTKEVDVPVKEVQPTVTSEQASQVKDVIGKYSTNYSGSGSSGRVINMRVAASRLNGVVVNPGETFSTNKCFGESTPENGYKLAGAYINGKLDQDYGGGVCQVSTTLYNAVLRAELEVVERANHSLTVGYVPRGFDATLAGDYIDLKFKNNFSIPVYIESYLTDGQVVVILYGKEEHPAGRTLEFKSKYSNGSYKTYKDVYQDGKLIEEVYLSSSSYKNLNNNGNTNSTTTTTTRATTTEAHVETTTKAKASVSKPKTNNNVKKEPATQTTTKAPAPKTETPKTEAPKTEVPKTEAPKTEAPKTETPKTEAPVAEKTPTPAAPADITDPA